MGIIADRVRQMRGCSLADIVAEIEAMESAALNVGEDDFANLWKSYPHKTAKKAAEKAYKAARKRGVPHSVIAEGMARYVERKPPDRPWLHLATFLNGERWNDEEAPLLSPLTNLQRREAQLREDLENGRYGGGRQAALNPPALPRLARG